MKFLKFLSIFLAAALILTACEKEYSYEDGTAKGSLKKDDATQDCLPITVNGTYVKDTTLKTATNFVDLQVNITETGAYDIRTDTVNGYYFRAVGSTAVTGMNAIRMIGYGKPIAPNVDQFTVAFDTSHCTFDVQVTATASSTGKFTLGTTASSCTGIALAGTYTATTPMTASNTASISIQITQPGTYSVVSTPASVTAGDNGVTFSAAGNFISNGSATLVLTASGTPLIAGAFTYNLTDGTNTCSFTVTYGAAAPPATIASVDCTGATFTGTYQAGASATGNTVTISVTPATPGSYNITTTLANGVTFAGTGTFTTTTAQPVVLTATGTAGSTTGAVSYPVTAGTATCAFSVNYAAGAGPAAFSITCTGIVVNGDYVKGLALDATNTITVPVNVTTAGAYTMTATAATGGVTFNGAGTFSTTGPQTITLSSTQTSTAGGSVIYTTNSTSATASCTFTVNYDFVEYTIDGGIGTENCKYSLDAFYDDDNIISGYSMLFIEGYMTAASSDNHGFVVGVGIPTGGSTPGTGVYTSNDAPAKVGLGIYTDAAQTSFAAFPQGTPQTPFFTINITSITATRVEGTFSGALRDDTGAGAVTKNVTNGAFSVKIL